MYKDIFNKHIQHSTVLPKTRKAPNVNVHQEELVEQFMIHPYNMLDICLE